MCQSSQTSGLRGKFGPLEFADRCSFKVLTQMMGFEFEWCDFNILKGFSFFKLTKNIFLHLRHNSRFPSS